MFQLAPSIISADFKDLQSQLNIIEGGGIRHLHLDVMDGVYVPALSFGIPFIRSIRSGTGLIFDVHLMVEDPERYIIDLFDAGADIIILHVEAVKDLVGALKEIKNHGLRAGVALNPETPLTVLTDEIFDLVDVINVMSVEPGCEGQKFIRETIEKISDLKKKINLTGREIEIEVDGDINIQNVDKILMAGADIIVSGRAIFEGDIAENISNFNAEFEKYRMGGKVYETSDWH